MEDFNENPVIPLSPAFKPRVFFIGVEGNIGSGKSTFLVDLAYAIKNTSIISSDAESNIHIIIGQEPVETFREVLTLFASNPERNSYLAQTAILNKRTKAFKKIKKSAYKYAEENPSTIVVVILERTFLGDSIFAISSHLSNFMTEIEYNEYVSIRRTFEKCLGIDILAYIYIRPSVDDCMARMRARERDFEKKLQLDYLKDLQLHHDNVLGYKNGRTTGSANVHLYENPDMTEEARRQSVMNMLQNVVTHYTL